MLVVDTAHGHSHGVLDVVRQIRAAHEIELVAGNISTGDGALALVDAGADAVKVGQGPGRPARPGSSPASECRR